MKKADLSINVIVVAVLALLVLVVLIFVFSDKINVFGKGVSTCQGKCLTKTTQTGYERCEQEPESQKNGVTIKYTYNPSGKCEKQGTIEPVCCMETPVG